MLFRVSDNHFYPIPDDKRKSLITIATQIDGKSDPAGRNFEYKFGNATSSIHRTTNALFNYCIFITYS